MCLFYSSLGQSSDEEILSKIKYQYIGIVLSRNISRYCPSFDWQLWSWRHFTLHILFRFSLPGIGWRLMRPIVKKFKINWVCNWYTQISSLIDPLKHSIKARGIQRLVVPPHSNPLTKEIEIAFKMIEKWKKKWITF